MSETWTEQQAEMRKHFLRILRNNAELFDQYEKEARSRFGNSGVVRVYIRKYKTGSRVFASVHAAEEMVAELKRKQKTRKFGDIGRMVRELLALGTTPYLLPETPFLVFSKFGASYLLFGEPLNFHSRN